jgi:hypothetical protein
MKARTRLEQAGGFVFPGHQDVRSCGMGLFTKDIKTMNDLFVHQLQDIYYAEKQLVKALPKMAGKAAQTRLFEPSRRNQNACSAS